MILQIYIIIDVERLVVSLDEVNDGLHTIPKHRPLQCSTKHLICFQGIDERQTTVKRCCPARRYGINVKGLTEVNLPFLANAGGFPFEYAQSATHFLESPHGPAGIVSPACLRVYSIPKDILAKDVLNILAQDTRNLEAIMSSSRAALVAPPVPGCDRENYCRLFLLGDIRATLHLDALDSHMAQYYPDDYTPWTMRMLGGSGICVMIPSAIRSGR